MREISLDTETTGLNPKSGHRVVEIGCVEMMNHVSTGETFHVYINPERDMPEEAFRVHGLSEEFLRSHQVFAKIAEDFIEFIGDSALVIHNAQFDIGFLNAELNRLGKPELDMSRTIDTVHMARKKFPGAQANLDALCRRFGIDNSNRELHGALLDAELLAEVYLELKGGRQTGFGLGEDLDDVENVDILTGQVNVKSRPQRKQRTFTPSNDELIQHQKFIETLKESLWKA